ncbi:MAG TPA: hypothetical protein VFT30_00795 [Nitrospira sp.]|nr:hypothetical protein [Nitrospira sp.]
MESTNPLQGLLPARVRQILYAILFVAGLVFALWQAAEGDWLLFIGSLFPALLGLLAAGNTTST